jgi:hypothetical protein
MPRERMCEYGNCTSTDIAVTVNYRKEQRPAFCCAEHAALWLLRTVLRLRGRHDAYTRIEHLVLQEIEQP